jgi:hypothetical protein
MVGLSVSGYYTTLREADAETMVPPKLIGIARAKGVPFRDIAEAIGRQLKLPVVSIAAEDAGEHFGWLSAIVSVDNPTSSALTRERLGWQPKGPSLIADIEQGHYFNER